MTEGMAAPAAAPAAPAPAPSAPSAPATSNPGISAPTGGGEAKPSSDTPAIDAPPGWMKRDGKWYVSEKVNGEDIELDAEEAMHHVRTKESATRKWQEASRMRQEMEQLLEGAAKSPAAMARLAAQLGMNTRELAEHILAESLADERLTPEQKRIRELEARVAEVDREREERELEAQEAQRTQKLEAETKHLVTQFDKALDEAGAAKSPRVRQMLHQRVAQLVQHHQANAIPTTLQKITQRAIQDVQAQVAEFGGSVVAAPPPIVDPAAGQPKRVVPPPPPAGAQAPSQHARDGNGRFLPQDPKPHFDHRIPGSMKALSEWRSRNPGRG